MADTKLINLLRSLSSDELKQFEKFVDSAYHNKGRDLTQFLKTLKSYYPDFNQKSLSNELLFKKIFPGKKFDEIKSANHIRTLTSHLFRLCKDFLIQLELESQVSSKKYLLLNQLRKRKLYKEFDKEFEAKSASDENISKGSIGYFVNDFLLKAVKRDCSLNRDDFRSSVEYSIGASESILTAALISCYKFEDEKNLSAAYNIHVRENMLQTLLDNFSHPQMLEKLKKSSAANFPYLEIYFYVYMMNKFRNDASYYRMLKKLLMERSALFGMAENYVLWNTLLTYCGVCKIDVGEIFEIQKYMVENGVYKLSNKENFHIVLFRNIVLNSHYLGEHEWLEQFIEKYIPELHEFHRDNMRSYSLAFLHYSRSEFEKALGCILKIKYNLFLFKLDLKILQLKIYYELQYFEEALSLIASTQNYISNTKELAPFIKQSMSDFLKCLKPLINFRISRAGDTVVLEEIRSRAKTILFTNLSTWLLLKAEEIENGND